MDYIYSLLPYRRRENEKDLKFTFKVETKNFDIEIIVRKKDNSQIKDEDVCEDCVLDELKNKKKLNLFSL